MGLGKTAQSISVLAYQRQFGGISGPFLGEGWGGGCIAGEPACSSGSASRIHQGRFTSRVSTHAQWWMEWEFRACWAASSAAVHL